MKKVFFGLLVAAIAVGGSAFTNVQKLAEGDLYGNGSSEGDYTLRTGPYNPTLCLTASTAACAYLETAEGEGIVTAPFSAAQAQEWVDAGYLIQVGSDGVYNGE